MAEAERAPLRDQETGTGFAWRESCPRSLLPSRKAPVVGMISRGASVAW